LSHTAEKQLEQQQEPRDGKFLSSTDLTNDTTDSYAHSDHNTTGSNIILNSKGSKRDDWLQKAASVVTLSQTTAPQGTSHRPFGATNSGASPGSPGAYYSPDPNVVDNHYDGLKVLRTVTPNPKQFHSMTIAGLMLQKTSLMCCLWIWVLMMSYNYDLKFPVPSHHSQHNKPNKHSKHNNNHKNKSKRRSKLKLIDCQPLTFQSIPGPPSSPVPQIVPQNDKRARDQVRLVKVGLNQGQKLDNNNNNNSNSNNNLTPTHHQKP
jgi:hypothetical protein